LIFQPGNKCGDTETFREFGNHWSGDRGNTHRPDICGCYAYDGFPNFEDLAINASAKEAVVA